MHIIGSEFFSDLDNVSQGRNWVIMRGGAGIFMVGRIIHGPSQSVKCVAPLFGDISLANV